jgi:hypothetical protein
MFTLAVTVPLFVPDTGLRANHAAFSEAVQDKVPLPVLEMLMGLAAGFVPPTVPVNVRLVGLKPIAALAVDAVIVNVTGRVLAGTPEAVTEMMPLWVPAAKLVRFTLTVIVPLLVPDTGLRANHAAFSEAVQDKVPPPTFETAMV